MWGCQLQLPDITVQPAPWGMTTGGACRAMAGPPNLPKPIMMILWVRYYSSSSRAIAI